MSEELLPGPRGQTKKRRTTIAVLDEADDSIGPAFAVPVVLSRKAQLRRVAVRNYARLRLHARNCTDCTPGATDNDPPRIYRGCRFGVTGKTEYERAYRAWVECPEGSE